MIPFGEKVHFEVYNRDKPDKYGVKSYQLYDSSDGFCCRIEIYTSVNKNPPSAKGKTSILVMRLIKRYLSVGWCLFVDHYYTLPILFTDLYQLYQLHTGACGTAHYRRGIPDAFQIA